MKWFALTVSHDNTHDNHQVELWSTVQYLTPVLSLPKGCLPHETM